MLRTRVPSLALAAVLAVTATGVGVEVGVGSATASPASAGPQVRSAAPAAPVVPVVPGARVSSSAGRPEDPQVLAISIDGLNPTALVQLGRTGAPHFWQLFREGAGTLNARTQVERTVTLPNHTSMVTGVRIDRRRGGHGVTWNDDRTTPPTVQAAARRDVGSVFSRVQEARRSAALFSTKTKFALFQRSWPAGVDRMAIREQDDAAVVALARADLRRTDRDFTFLHLGAADAAGHASGWLSEPYLDAVRRLDGLVGLVMDDATRLRALRDLTIVLTADHGGTPGTRDHDAAGRYANYRIPFVVWGHGVAHRDLYRANPGYERPGRTQPDLRGKQPIRNGDVANLALSLLDLGPVQGSQFGVRRPLLVPRPPAARPR